MGTSAQSIPPGRRQVEALPHITTMVDEATILKVCDIYDWDGKGELDLFFLGDVVYACGLNTTKKVCVSLGQTDEEGKSLPSLLISSRRPMLPLTAVESTRITLICASSTTKMETEP